MIVICFICQGFIDGLKSAFQLCQKLQYLHRLWYIRFDEGKVINRDQSLWSVCQLQYFQNLRKVSLYKEGEDLILSDNDIINLIESFYVFLSQILYTVLQICPVLLKHILEEFNENCDLINLDVVIQFQPVGAARNRIVFFDQLLFINVGSPSIKYFQDLLLENGFGELEILNPIRECGLESWLKLSVPVLCNDDISHLVLFTGQLNAWMLYIFLHVLDDMINELCDVLPYSLNRIDTHLLAYH